MKIAILPKIYTQMQGLEALIFDLNEVELKSSTYSL